MTQLPTVVITAEFAAGNQSIGSAVRHGFTLSRGSMQPSLTGMVADAGQFTTTLENFTRQFDPTYTSSAYYPDVVPGVPISVVATWNAVAYPLFKGRVEGWSQTYGTAGLDQIVQVEALDAVAELAEADVTGPFVRQLSGARITDVLDAVGFSGAYTLNAGTAMLPAVGSDVTTKAWSLIADAAAAEWGYVFASGAGSILFLDRNGLATSSERTSSQGTFGDQSGELLYDDIEVPYGRTRIVNAAALGYNDKGAVARGEDLTSQAEPWRKRSWSQNIPMEDVTLANSYVDHLVDTYANPTVRVARIRVTPSDDPTTLWPKVLAMEPGYMFTVKRTPIGGGARIERTVFVRGVSHALVDGEWTTDIEFDDSTLVTVGVHYGDGTEYDDAVSYSF